jgi:DNA-binding NtrC family response regulator
VRQLENAVERAIAFSAGEEIPSLELDSHSPAPASASGDPAAETAAAPAFAGGAPTLNDIERAYIHWVLTQNQWHKPTAARILGLDISTLYRKIEKYGLKGQS